MKHPHHYQPAFRISQGGFTLIEIFVAMAILSIVLAIAIPSYISSVKKGARSDAKARLLETVQYMERYYTVNNTYATAAIPDAYAPLGTTSATAKYQISFSGAPSTNTFTIKATPVNTQIGDSCGSLTVDSVGNKTPNSCW
jgi:type IV pilus assembly protein PilE